MKHTSQFSYLWANAFLNISLNLPKYFVEIYLAYPTLDVMWNYPIDFHLMSERSERQHNNFTFLSLCYTWANFSVSFGTLPLVESATSLLFQILNRIFEIDIHRFSIIRFVSPIMAFVVAKIPVAIAKKLPQWMVLPTPLLFCKEGIILHWKGFEHIWHRQNILPTLCPNITRFVFFEYSIFPNMCIWKSKRF